MHDVIEHYRKDTQAGRLAYQLCRGCGHRQAFVRRFCSRCGATDLEWCTANGTGVVAAHSILHRAPTPDYRDQVPYAVALVELEEGVRVMGHAALDLRIGERVWLSFTALGQRHLVRFERSTRGN